MAMRLNWLANIKLKEPGLPGTILLWGAHLNWLAKIELKEARAP